MNILLSNRPIKGTPLDAVLAARVRDGATASTIAIVPTRRKANLLRRRWLLDSPNRAAHRFPVFTLSDLVATIAEHVLPRRQLVTEELQYALLDQAARATRLGYFTKHQSTLPRGTLQTILNTIIKLKEAGTLPEDLHAAAELGEGRDHDKAADIAALYSAYDALLDDRFRDAPGTLLELDAALATRPFAAMLDATLSGWRESDDRLIVVEGFSEFRRPECVILSACARVERTTAAIICDYAPGNAALFGHLDEHLARLQNDGFPHRALIEENDSRWTRRVQTRCFSDAHPDPQPFPDAIVLRPYNRRAEAETIARIVKGLVRERPGRDLSRICVATRLPGRYTPLFREAFADAGIPVNITDRFPLAESAVAIGLVALLDLQLRDFRVRDVARALATPYYAIGAAGERVDAEGMIALATRLRIAGGRRAWVERLQSRAAMLRSGDVDEERDAETEARACERAAAELETVRDALKQFESRCSARTFRKHIETLFRTCDTVRNTLAGAFGDVDAIERETRALHALRELIDGVCNVLQVQHGDTPVALAEFARLIRAAMTVARYNVRPRSGTGVLITSADETRGLEVDVMIVAGLVDGEFPLPYAPEVFLSKNFQTSRRRHGQDERYLFYQTVTNWHERLILTAPSADDSGKELTASMFIEALRDHVTFGDDLPEGATTAIVAQSALQRTLGRLSHGKRPLPEIAEAEAMIAAITAGVDHEARRHAHQAPQLEGFIDGGITDSHRDALHDVQHRVWSASQLESYAKCPFRYFSSHHLRLRERDRLVEGLSPQERGTLLHSILYTFHIRRRDRGAAAIARLSDAEYRDAERELLRIGADTVDALGIQHPFWRLDIDRVLGLSHRVGILQRYLALERSRTSAVSPAFFEVQFGSAAGKLGKSDPRLHSDDPVDFGAWRLRGKIDRIDAGEAEFVIVDYKTGDSPSLREMDEGLSLQLPLYIRAAQQLLRSAGATGAPPTVYGHFYSLRSECKLEQGLLPTDRVAAVLGDGRRRTTKLPAEEFERIVDGAFEHVANTHRRIGAGEFPLTPVELRTRSCRSCPYGSMCRVKDEVGGVEEEM